MNTYLASAWYNNLFFEAGDLSNYGFPLSPYGLTRWEKDGEFFQIRSENGKRHIEFSLKEKVVMQSFNGNMVLTDPPESISVVRPFKESKQFFYENKIFGMPVEGEVNIRGKTYLFEPEYTSAILDWGRLNETCKCTRQNHRSIRDTDNFDVEWSKSILVGPNIGKTE